jgi:leucyl/phenylalanyl-tRNA---protein transferase
LPGDAGNVIPWIEPGQPFPGVEDALESPNGLLCAGAELTPERILEAYRQGIFPWYGEGDPVLWWSPDPRMVLFPGELKVSRSLGKIVRRGVYETRVDSEFGRVMRACAAPRNGQSGTWIVPEMIEAYGELHRRGFAHSVESWLEGELVGGLYGLWLGKVFFGESMFSRATDASKVALVQLVRILAGKGARVIDCQQATRHLGSLGARPIPRKAFSQLLQDSIQCAPSGESWADALPNGQT